MTLLQRAPREVYRVFGEDEFLARVEHEPRLAPLAPGAAERRVRRPGGTTVLLAAAGAVGGLLVVVSVFSASGTRRRTAVRPLASTASTRGMLRSSSHVTGARALRTRTQSRGSRNAGAGTHAKRTVAMPPTASRGASVAAVPARRSAPIEAGPSGGRAYATVGGGQPQRAGRSEFGFER
jgi:hypothetical protein